MPEMYKDPSGRDILGDGTYHGRPLERSQAPQDDRAKRKIVMIHYEFLCDGKWIKASAFGSVVSCNVPVRNLVPVVWNIPDIQEDADISPGSQEDRAKRIARVGSKVPLNVYIDYPETARPERPLCQCHTPEDALLVAKGLNAIAALEQSEAALVALREENERLKSERITVYRVTYENLIDNRGRPSTEWRKSGRYFGNDLVAAKSFDAIEACGPCDPVFQWRKPEMFRNFVVESSLAETEWKTLKGTK